MLNMPLFLSLIAGFAVALATVWALTRRSPGNTVKPSAGPDHRAKTHIPPRLGILDAVKGDVHIATPEPASALQFRFIGASSLFEITVPLVITNNSTEKITLKRITWDVWMSSMHIKYGEYTEPLAVEPGMTSPPMALREVLKESEAADVSWANQQSEPRCYIEGCAIIDTAHGPIKKLFSVSNLKFTIVREGAKLKATDFLRDAYLDGLTGLLQRKFIEDNMATIIDRNVHFEPISFVMMDIDDFKIINDTHGHLAGDEVLRRVSTLLKLVVDSRGFCVRYGGDEFSIILENCSAREAESLCRQIFNEIHSAPVVFNEKNIPFSMSAGIATTTQKISYLTLIQRADEMLLFSKKSGKNQISTDQRRIIE